MKRTLILAALLLVSVGASLAIEAGPGAELRGTTTCTHSHDEYNAYGGWVGRYDCTTSTGRTYCGYGPAQSEPPAIEP
ncbi:MAG: hypothetical protein AAF657_39165 [Acidobacteriota bacterium]